MGSGRSRGGVVSETLGRRGLAEVSRGVPGWVLRGTCDAPSQGRAVRPIEAEFLSLFMDGVGFATPPPLPRICGNVPPNEPHP